MSSPLHPKTKEIIGIVSGILGGEAQTVLVGGSVRDTLLGKEPKDYDFATALLPDEIEMRVRAAGKRAYTIGKRFGTIGFRHEGQVVEVTTFRSELYSPGSRKPAVTFTDDLYADLARRDFTINAIALDIHTSELVDPFLGAGDIEAGVLRAVGKPSHRFREDPLRILRLIRFVARFGFAVDPNTAKAAAKQAYTLTTVSTERISTEMDAILVAPQAAAGLQLMAELGLLSFAVPLLAVQFGYNQNTPFHRYTLWEHTVKTVEGVEPNIDLRWAALLHDIGKPFVRLEKPGRSTYVHHDRVGAILVGMLGRHLHWSAERLKYIQSLVRTHLDDTNPIRQSDNAAK
ncbi:MAG TPA: CCA tRNA nucleotidyltransferase [Candidatus Saccharimonadales bacterium]|nr:CCA tRNA nucleotidyltransferase [Candidatus Saccharimonadales bacterium]